MTIEWVTLVLWLSTSKVVAKVERDPGDCKIIQKTFKDTVHCIPWLRVTF